MGLSRRKFTREFKLTAVRRLEGGASVAEVARAFEVNPNVVHRWRREFRQGPGNAFSGAGKQRWRVLSASLRDGSRPVLLSSFSRGGAADNEPCEQIHSRNQ